MSEKYKMFQLKEPTPYENPISLNYKETIEFIDQITPIFKSELSTARVSDYIYSGYFKGAQIDNDINFGAIFTNRVDTRYLYITKDKEGENISFSILNKEYKVNNPWYFGPILNVGHNFYCATKEMILKYTLYPELIEKFKNLQSDTQLYVLCTVGCYMVPGAPSTGAGSMTYYHPNYQFSLLECQYTLGEFYKAFGMIRDPNNKKITIRPEAAGLFD